MASNRSQTSGFYGERIHSGACFHWYDEFPTRATRNTHHGGRRVAVKACFFTRKSGTGNSSRAFPTQPKRTGLRPFFPSAGAVPETYASDIFAPSTFADDVDSR
ncbi:hypothetical protein [uncultured Gimesia sp.]|uniref:hypothetical protein n=1 Tax=uncultured Gimesia sp. TaxID=1678688 RepID=UPI002623974D|nr:hypothetical protein [uncultured Gimesia sp.]